ncbi:hypothetical protein ACOSP7_024711 [Xanthoceras sorbifolium]
MANKDGLDVVGVKIEGVKVNVNGPNGRIMTSLDACGPGLLDKGLKTVKSSIWVRDEVLDAQGEDNVEKELLSRVDEKGMRKKIRKLESNLEGLLEKDMLYLEAEIKSKVVSRWRS